MLPFIGPRAGATLFPPVKLAGTPYPLNGGSWGSLASILFGNGEDGFLFGDFTELDELFTTFNGTTNVASDSDPVGNALDDHSWGALTFAQVMAAQPEIWPQPSFASSTGLNLGTGWSIAGNKATKVAGTAAGLAAVTGTVIAGALYRVQYTTTAYGGSGTINAQVGGVENNFNAGVNTFTEYIRATSTVLPLLFGGSSYSGDVSAMSVKLVPGNNLLQANTSGRPLWNANGGKPYLSGDGINDYMQSSIFPQAASGTLAVAFYPTDIQDIPIGGGGTAGNRAFLCTDTTGGFGYGFGDLNTIANSTTSILNGWHVGILTWVGLNATVYLDGNVFFSVNAATGPNGAGGSISLLAVTRPSAANWLAGRVSAALALSRAITPAEAARITTDFKGTYQ